MRELDETDFYSAPASTSKHGAYEGGLLNHSMNVYKLLVNFNKNIKCEREDYPCDRRAAARCVQNQPVCERH